MWVGVGSQEFSVGGPQERVEWVEMERLGKTVRGLEGFLAQADSDAHLDAYQLDTLRAVLQASRADS